MEMMINLPEKFYRVTVIQFPYELTQYQGGDEKRANEVWVELEGCYRRFYEGEVHWEMIHEQNALKQDADAQREQALLAGDPFIRNKP